MWLVLPTNNLETEFLRSRMKDLKKRKKTKLKINRKRTKNNAQNNSQLDEHKGRWKGFELFVFKFKNITLKIKLIAFQASDLVWNVTCERKLCLSTIFTIWLHLFVKNYHLFFFTKVDENFKFPSGSWLYHFEIFVKCIAEISFWNISLKIYYIILKIFFLTKYVNGLHRNDLPITICFAFLHTDDIYDKQNKTLSVQ